VTKAVPTTTQPEKIGNRRREGAPVLTRTDPGPEPPPVACRSERLRGRN
jgi:hypothetical protein